MNFLTEVSGPPAGEAPDARWMFQRIEYWAERLPDRLALVMDHQGEVQEYRYADVLVHAGRISAVLGDHAIRRGDRVGILMENTPQWVFVLLGAMRFGAIAVPLATSMPEASLEIVAQHAGCRLVFADDPNFDKGERLAGKLKCEVLRPTVEAGSEPPSFPHKTGEETGLIIYTSGTTGNPKGVELSYDNLNYEIRGVVEVMQLSPGHRILSILPFSHVLPLIANALGPLCVGAGVVFLSSISPQRVIEAFHRHRITFFICVPQFFYLVHKRIFDQVAAQPVPMRLLFRLMKSVSAQIPNIAFRRRLFSKIHTAIGPDLQLLASGGSRFDPQVGEDLQDLGYTMLQAYGLTETAAAATVTSPESNRVGSVGKPIRGVTVHIDSPNENGIGEVWIRGPIVMKGYYRSPEATNELLQNGWLHTGDLGLLDSESNLKITGRSKDVIVLSNGKKVYPEEAETHYSQSPFIKELCVIGVTDKGNRNNSESLHAVVVPNMDEFRKRGQTRIAETIRFEMENLSKQVPSYQRIHSFTIRNEPFPRTVTRKLKRFEIEKEEAAHRAAPQERQSGHDDLRFQGRIGAVIAEAIRSAKPQAGPLDPSLNLELDLGFDSLGRVELLASAETQLGVHIDEERAARIFTLGELVDAFENSGAAEAAPRRTWKEILDIPPDDELYRHYILNSRILVDPAAFIIMRLVKFAAKASFRLRYYGLEKLPQRLPFILCPNHESFLDGPLLVSTLPRQIIYNMFVLGYSDYWQNAFSRGLAKLCNIVAIDSSANLVRAMQVGAAGIKNNQVLLIFPEGTRSIDGRLAEFKRGAAILSYELDAPIVPVGIRGTFEAWPRGGHFRLHPVEIHFGDPIYPETFRSAADPYAAITEKLQKEVMALVRDAGVM